MTPHRWSGWPGAWCLDCGAPDPTELCLDHAVWAVDGDDEFTFTGGRFECPDGTHVESSCPEPMSRRHDPYAPVDLSGSFFATVAGGRMRRLRPDWMEIVTDGKRTADGGKIVGYFYYPGGKGSAHERVVLRPDEVVREPTDADDPESLTRRLKSPFPDVAWKWGKWTFGFWVDRANRTAFGVDVGPLEVVWRHEGYRP